MEHTLPGEVGVLKFKWRELTTEIEQRREKLLAHHNALPREATLDASRSEMMRSIAGLESLKTVVEGSVASLGVQAVAEMNDTLDDMVRSSVSVLETFDANRRHGEDEMSLLREIYTLQQQRADVAMSRERIVEASYVLLTKELDHMNQLMTWASLYIRSIMAERVRWQEEQGINPAKLPQSTSFVQRCLQGLSFLSKGVKDADSYQRQTDRNAPVHAVDSAEDVANRFFGRLDTAHRATAVYVSPKEELAILRELLKGSGSDDVVSQIEAMREEAHERQARVQRAHAAVRTEIYKLRTQLDALRESVREEINRCHQFPLEEALHDIIATARAESESRAATERRDLVEATQLLLEKSRRQSVSAAHRRVSAAPGTDADEVVSRRDNSRRPSAMGYNLADDHGGGHVFGIASSRQSSAGPSRLPPSRPRTSVDDRSSGAVTPVVPPPEEPVVNSVAPPRSPTPLEHRLLLVNTSASSSPPPPPMLRSHLSAQRGMSSRRSLAVQPVGHGGDSDSEEGGEPLRGFGTEAMSTDKSAPTSGPPDPTPALAATRSRRGGQSATASRPELSVRVEQSYVVDREARRRNVELAVQEVIDRHSTFLADPSRVVEVVRAPLRRHFERQERLSAKVRRALQITETLRSNSETIHGKFVETNAAARTLQPHAPHYSEAIEPQRLVVDAKPAARAQRPQTTRRSGRQPVDNPLLPREATVVYTDWLNNRLEM